MSVFVAAENGAIPAADREPSRNCFAEQQLRALVAQVPAVVWTADTEHRFTSVMGSGSATLSGDPRGHGSCDEGSAARSAYDRALAGERTSY